MILIFISTLVLSQKFHLTADKREIKDFPKLPSATSFTPGMIYGNALLVFRNKLGCI